MAREDRVQNGILGNIRPDPGTTEHVPSRKEHADEGVESMVGGSQHDRSEHSGSRDVTEGTTGGVGTETGGTRNFRTGTGATGTDIGNKPE